MGQVHGKCLRMFETAEIEKQSLLEETSHLKSLLDKAKRENSKKQAEITKLQRKKNEDDYRPEKIFSQAIVVERNGKISSPLVG